MRAVEWFIAWRYLFSRERGALVSLITFISVAGVAVGVGALIVVIGVMDGADDQLLGRIANLYPHVRVVDSREGDHPIDQALLERLRAHPLVERAEPVYERQTLLQSSGEETRQPLIRLIGTDTIGHDSLFRIDDDNAKRTYRIPDGELFAGMVLLSQIGTMPGQELVLTATNPHRGAAAPIFKKIRIPVSAYFKTGIFEFDASTAFVSRATFAELYRMQPGSADYIHVKLHNPFRAGELRDTFDFPDHYRVTTWDEENNEFFGALRLEKLGLGLTLLLTVLVAAFNIIGTLILTVMDKTREIGLLRAIGAGERTIRRIFLLDGIMIGMIGTAVGTVLGVILCLVLRAIEFDLPAEVYAFDSLPVTIRPLTIVIVIAAAMAICTLGAIFPAQQAARLDPVESLRHD